MSGFVNEGMGVHLGRPILLIHEIVRSPEILVARGLNGVGFVIKVRGESPEIITQRTDDAVILDVINHHDTIEIAILIGIIIKIVSIVGFVVGDSGVD